MLDIDFNPIVYTRIFTAIAVFLQSLELLLLRRSYSESGVWRWSILKHEFLSISTPLSLVIKHTLPYDNFLILLFVRLISAGILVFYSNYYLVLFLFFSSLLISIRWRGAFNGGSDYMTVILLLSLSVIELFPESPLVALGAIYYIAIQSCCSYFIAGVVKAKSPNWRSGAALRAFVYSGTYLASPKLLNLLCRPAVAIAACSSIIIFECLFPLAFISKELALVFLTCGFMFHLLNVYMFGLSRFFFIWVSTYPAILWCSGRVY